MPPFHQVRQSRRGGAVTERGRRHPAGGGPVHDVLDGVAGGPRRDVTADLLGPVDPDVDAADLRVTVGNALLPSLSLAVATVIPYRLQSAVRIAFLNESFSRGVTCNGIGQEATMGRATSTSGWPTPYFSNTSEPNSVLSTTSFSYAT